MSGTQYAANMPGPNTPFIDVASGNVTQAWYHYLLQILERTGGLVGVSTAQALAIALAAQAAANNAVAVATSAEALAAYDFDGDFQTPPRLEPEMLADDGIADFFSVFSPIGAFVSSSIAVGAAVALTSGVSANVTSIALSVGDWQCFGNVSFNPAGTTTYTAAAAGISTTSATFSTNPSGGGAVSLANAAGFGAGVQQILPAGGLHLSLGVPTTVFLLAQSTFAVSTMTANGFIGARRVR